RSVGGAVLCFFLLLYSMLVVRESSAGRSALPTWPGVTVWSDLAARAPPVAGAVILAIVPVALALGFCLHHAPEGGAPGFAASSSREVSPPMAVTPEPAAAPRSSRAPAKAHVLWTAPVPSSTWERIRLAGPIDALLLLAGFLASAFYLPMAFLA